MSRQKNVNFTSSNNKLVLVIGDFSSNVTNSLTPKRDTSNGIIRVFPKIDDSGSVDNKGLLREEQNKFSKSYLQWGLNLGPWDSPCGTLCVIFSCLPR